MQTELRIWIFHPSLSFAGDWIFHPILSFAGDWIFHPILSFAGKWIFHPIFSFAGDWILHPILIVWRSSIGRQFQKKKWVYTRAKYITDEESARFSCFDTNQHLEQDDLPVTKDVNQRIGLSRLIADVFQSELKIKDFGPI